MKHLKPLIKIELKTALLMSIFFWGVSIFTVVSLNNYIQPFIYNNLMWGMDGFNESSRQGAQFFQIYEWGNIFNHWIDLSKYIMAIGIMLLIYLSYRYDKNHEVGRFIKALPYTTEQKYWVKIVLGIMSFTIPYMVQGMVIVIIRKSFIIQMKDFYEVTNLSNIFADLYELKQLLLILTLNYLGLIVWYLFVVMFQYIIMSNFGSIIGASIIAIAPIVIRENIHRFFSYTGRLYWKYIRLYDFLLGNRGYRAFITNKDTGIIEYINFGETRLVVLFIMILILLTLTLYLCKEMYIENEDALVPRRVFKYMYLIVTPIVCSLLLGSLYKCYTGKGDTWFDLVTFIGGILGFLIAKMIMKTKKVIS